MNSRDAAPQRPLDRRRLRQHAIGDAAFVTEFSETGYVDIGNQRSRIFSGFEYARRRRREHQFFGTDRRCHGCRDGIGIDIQ